ncbi:MAG: 16S rRNA (guanine(966)-N(2))-methyltransferase RsmD [Clostridiaceae bacterium]|nr:16S rRNA (guanine(966)-N(2))-methyltransferase RsmD [Clostridiaceae bacterium]
MVRVIAGAAKGRKLKTIDSDDTRPTLDRVKEAMFSILLPWIDEATVVDVFAGNGSLGIEALSRGAEYAHFNDMSRQCCRVVKENLRTTGFDDRASVHNLDYSRFIQLLHRMDVKADIILLDPPYGKEMIKNCLEVMTEHDICNDGCIVLAEHAKNDELDESIGCFEKNKTKHYGKTSLTLFTRKV